MKLAHYCLVLALALFFSFHSIAQIDFNNYVTLQAQGDIPDDFTKQTFDKLTEELKKGRSDIKKSKQRDFLEGTNYAIDNILHSGVVVYGDEITNYVNEIADKLLANDSELRSKLRFYTIKSNATNAFSTDQGIVFVTTGLIAQLTSEAQLAFILAHEISHYTEKHVVETYDWRLKNNHQDDHIERLSQYSQEKEFEADRLGIEMYKAAGYASSEIVPTFDVLMYSYLPFDDIEFPKTYFNTANIFVPETLFPSKKFPIKAEEDYDDSESSHPNIKKRKEASQEEIGKLSGWGAATEFLGKERFATMRTISRFESVRTDILNTNYADALYSIFLLERDYPQSMYLKRMKAQIWLNFSTYKNENKSSQLVKKASELEGESAALHAFLKKLNKEGLATLALRQVHDLHKASSSDDELSVIYKRTVQEACTTKKFKLENFSKKTFQQAAQEFIVAQDSIAKSKSKEETAEGTGTKGSKKGTKYDRIKDKKNISKPENFDSTNFYLYGISDIIKDAEFDAIYKEINEELEAEEIADKKYDQLTAKEKFAYDEKVAAEESQLGLTHLIVVEPMLESYKNGSINHVKSEKLEQVFAQSIEESALDAGIKTYPIDSRTLAKKGTQGFNERSLLINLLGQLSDGDKDMHIFPVDYQLLKTISTDYGTSKAMFSLVQHEYDADINPLSLLSAIFVYPALLIYVPLQFFSGSHTQMNVVLLDLDNGLIDWGTGYYFKDNPKKLQLGAHMYAIFQDLSKKPTNK